MEGGRRNLSFTSSPGIGLWQRTEGPFWMWGSEITQACFSGWFSDLSTWSSEIPTWSGSTKWEVRKIHFHKVFVCKAYVPQGFFWGGAKMSQLYQLVETTVKDLYVSLG